MRGLGFLPLLALILIGATSHAADPIEIQRGRRPIAAVRDSFFSPHSTSETRDWNRGVHSRFSNQNFQENEFCRNAYVSEFTVEDGIDSLPVNADYCELESEDVPASVQTLLEKIRILHVRYAETVGLPPEKLLSSGVHLRLAVDPAGPLLSRTRFDIEIALFSDSAVESFPEKIYFHELTHWLTNQQASYGDSIRSLEANYLFQEGFPDLIASYASQSPIIDLTDSTIRPELMASLSRDGTALKSMNAPFKAFYLGTFQNEVTDVCRKIPRDARTNNEESLCTAYELERAENTRKGGIYAGSFTQPPSARKLALPFQARNCVIRYRDGTSGFDACASYSFSPVLISFFHSIDSALGSRPMALLLRAIDEAAPSASNLVCRFDAEGTESVSFKLPSFVFALKTMRNSLDAPGQALFDSQWKTHGMDKWEEIENYDRKLHDEPFAYSQIVMRNEAFSARNRCGSKKLSARKEACRSTCRFMLPASNKR